MKDKIIFLVAFIFLTNVFVDYAQEVKNTPTDKDLKISDLEFTTIQSMAKDLLITQKDFKINQDESDRLQRQFSDETTAFNAELAKIKKDHNWGDDVSFDMNKSQFIKIAKPALPKKDDNKK